MQNHSSKSALERGLAQNGAGRYIARRRAIGGKRTRRRVRRSVSFQQRKERITEKNYFAWMCMLRWEKKEVKSKFLMGEIESGM
jgi:hypothetical protein